MRTLLRGDSRRAGYESLADLDDDIRSDGAAPPLPSCPLRHDSISSEAEKNCQARLQRYKKVLSLGYFLAMGVSGIVLRHLATKVGFSFEKVLIICCCCCGHPGSRSVFTPLLSGASSPDHQVFTALSDVM